MVGMLYLILASILATGEVGVDESLRGSLHGSELVVTVNGSGAVCRGPLVELAPGVGRGSLVCSDGRRGSFAFSRQEDGSGRADGHLGGDPLTIFLGSN